MRKIILNIVVSLDGFIEGPNGEFDWCFTDQDYGMFDFLEGIDAIFFGRKSFELLKQTENDPFTDKKKYVFSKTLNPHLHRNISIINRNVRRSIKNIINHKGKDIWLFGGSSLITYFINNFLK